LIELAYQIGEQLGLPVWCTDQAGPFQTLPYPGQSWQPGGQPERQPHEYIRNGVAKLLTLFHPSDGQLRAKGVTRCPNDVLHAWLKAQLGEILTSLPTPSADLTAEMQQATWQRWLTGLVAHPALLLDQLPPLRLLLVLDNLKGHKSPDFVAWLLAQGILPLYTPVAGSWLNMAESIQRIIQRRALDGQHPETPSEIMAWLEATVRGWNQAPTPFVWGGKVRRESRINDCFNWPQGQERSLLFYQQYPWAARRPSNGP
jgi:hypothetical protein